MDHKYNITEVLKDRNTLTTVYSKTKPIVLHVICYYITMPPTSKYPYLQFILENTYDDFSANQFTLPTITFYEITNLFEDIIMSNITPMLLQFGIDKQHIKYNGILWQNKQAYIMIDIAQINMPHTYLTTEQRYWNVLSSEIINNRSICGIPINHEITELFTQVPQIGVLYNYKDKPYIIPDAVYSGNEFNTAGLDATIGPNKYSIGNNLPTYNFHQTIHTALKDGAWIQCGGIHTIDSNHNSITDNMRSKLLPNNQYGKYIKGGITRYALFCDEFHVHSESNESIADNIMGPYTGVNVLFIYKPNNTNTIEPDIMVFNYDNIIPLSCHLIHSDKLCEKYEFDHTYDGPIIY